MIEVPGARPKRRRKRARQSAAVKSSTQVGFTKHADAHTRLHESDRVAWLVMNEFYARVRRMPGGPLGMDAGQCVCGSREIAKLLLIDRGKVRRAIARLEDVYGFISTAPSATGNGTTVTIPFVAGGPATTHNVGGGSRDQATHPRPTSRPTQVSTERQHSANGGDPHDQATRPRPTKRPQTETGETGETGVGAARHNSSKREGLGREDLDPQVVDLHVYQEKHRRRALREAYRPIPLSQLSRQIAERLVDHSIADCKAVIRADASEAGGGGKPSHFGPNTWSQTNFAHKLVNQLQVEQTRRERAKATRAERDQQPPEERFYVEQRTLGGYVRLNDGATERDVLLAQYDKFTRRFHKHKGTWPEVKHLWDREDHTWFRRDEVSDG